MLQVAAVSNSGQGIVVGTKVERPFVAPSAKPQPTVTASPVVTEAPIAPAPADATPVVSAPAAPLATPTPAPAPASASTSTPTQTAAPAPALPANFKAGGSFTVIFAGVDGCPSDIADYYKVQVYEEHDAYVSDAVIDGSGSASTADENGTFVCTWNFSADLPTNSVVYKFNLVQYRSGKLKDSQKSTTANLMAGQTPVLNGG